MIISPGLSPLRVGKLSHLKVRGKGGARLFLLTATNAPIGNMIWELDPDNYSIINSGAGPVQGNISGNLSSFNIGGNDEFLVFIDLYYGLFYKLNPNDFSIIATFPTPYTSTSLTAECSVGGDKDVIYAKFSKFTPAEMFILDPDTFTIISSSLVSLLPGIPTGLGGNSDVIWCCSTSPTLPTHNIEKRDPLTFAVLSNFQYAAGHVISIDGTKDMFRMVRGLSYSTTPDLNVYEFDSNYTLTAIKPIDPLVTGAIVSICGGKK